MVKIDYVLVKRKLESMRCPKCNEHPTATIIGNKIQLECCCDEFKQKLVTIAKETISEQLKTDISDEIRNIFKT